jgi:hypothetical protein
VLDCETPLGQVFIEEQYRVQRVLEARGYTVINTSGKDNNADVLLAKTIDGKLTISAMAEIKCRKTAGDVTLTREYLKGNGGYLITYSKLKYGSYAGSLLNIPFYVVVSLMAEGVILVWQITDSTGGFVEKFEVRETPTRKTVNGGEITRRNAFLSMESKFLTVIE